MRFRPIAGFTLVELIMVILLTSIVAMTVAVFIRRPVEGYLALSRRADLVDAAESAMRMMARDIRRALPNSVRISADARTIEMIDVVEAVRYRHEGPGNQDQRLRFNNTDTAFNTIGLFANITRPFVRNGEQLVIYNLGQSGADAYSGNGVITPVGTGFTIAQDADPAHPNEDRVTLAPGHQFSFESPNQRLFVVRGAIRYVCNPAAGHTSLTRFAGYPIRANITDAPGVAGVRLADSVSACTFTYGAGTAQHEAVVSIQLSLTQDAETVTLMHQVHVDNVP